MACLPHILTRHWLERICQSVAVENLCQMITTERRVVAVGSYGSSTNILAGALALTASRPVLLVVAHLDEADDALEDLTLFARGAIALPVERLAALEVLPGETGVSLELLAQRLDVIGRIAQSKETAACSPSVMITPIQAIMQSVPHPETLANYQLTIETDQHLPPAQLLDWLDRAGYTRTDAIEQPGDFATRGGIIDIYPPAGAATHAQTTDALGPVAKLLVGRASRPSSAVPADPPPQSGVQSLGPVRLDYFGDDIESIRLIDTDTMGSGQAIDRIAIVGASADLLQSDEDTGSFLDLLPDDTLVVMHEVMELTEQARGYYERLTNPRGIYAPKTVFAALTRRPHIEANQYSGASHDEPVVTLPVRPLMSFEQNAGKAVEQLIELAAGDRGTGGDRGGRGNRVNPGNRRVRLRSSARKRPSNGVWRNCSANMIVA